jgi:hypothetical protein
MCCLRVCLEDCNDNYSWTQTVRDNPAADTTEGQSVIFLRIESKLLFAEREYYHKYQSWLFISKVADGGRTKDGQVD